MINKFWAISLIAIGFILFTAANQAVVLHQSMVYAIPGGISGSAVVTAGLMMMFKK